jgi:hypothetical protein
LNEHRLSGHAWAFLIPRIKPIVVNEMSPNLNHAAKTAQRQTKNAYCGQFFTASSAEFEHQPFYSIEF